MLESQKLAPGTVLDGRYTVVRLIKAGGMGAVYEVTDRVLGHRRYALKQLIDPSRDPSERQAAIGRFLSEIQVMQHLSHPNIPRVGSSFTYENAFFFVMEFVEGTDLAHYLKEHGNPGLPAEQVVAWALQVLDALDYLHHLAPPVTHRDIKPSNLLLRERDGRVMLIDFGIARVTNPAEGLWIGTPGYAPGEQQQGAPEPASDIYALGATMHEMLTGRKPTADCEFPPFEELRVEVDPQLARIIFEALEFWPERRIPSARAMADRLRQLPGYDIALPAAGREHDFEKAVAALKLETLDPLLQELISRYNNECHTPYLPKNLDFLQFTLACPTPFELQVIKDAEHEMLRFYEKQGLLEPVLIGEVRPLDAQSRHQVPALVRRFVEDYEQFKNANWQLL